jgi:DNA ligase-1
MVAQGPPGRHDEVMTGHDAKRATAMPLADLVDATDAVGATSSRTAKGETLAELLRAADPAEAAVVASLVAGEPRQGRVGVGWATVAALDIAPAETPELTVTELDGLLDALGAEAGAGSSARREELLRRFLGRATSREADFVRRLLLGELRQGANQGVVVDGVARAAAVPAAAVRRALMLSGDLGATTTVALRDGRAGLDAVGLDLFRPIQPMLASTAPDVTTAMQAVGPVSVEWKLDGARVQVHRRDGRIKIWTRNLNDVTDRLPEVVAAVAELPVSTVVLDGEVLGIAGNDSPDAFQDTMSRFGTEDATGLPRLTPWFFDIMHIDGTDLIDAPLSTRIEHLAAVAGAHRVPGRITDDPDEATRILTEALERGHEGVMVKAADSTYQAGRRGKAWRKVKPVTTLDLVVLAVERGSGRRRGTLSNIHLGARDPETGRFVMVGKTFKGMTDEMLAWQTRRFTELKVEEEGHVVHVRPEQVVEVAVDGVQRSTRYPGGVALRFARVRGYRPDRDPDTADTIETVRGLL